jgi:hypothetical protein
MVRKTSTTVSNWVPGQRRVSPQALDMSSSDGVRFQLRAKR